MKKISKSKRIALLSSAASFVVIMGLGDQKGEAFLCCKARADTGLPLANSDVPQKMMDDKQWIMPNKNYSATNYSGLKEINSENVSKLKRDWTFDTGVKRGFESGTLVVHDIDVNGTKKNIMYIVTPFPNKVYALDLDDLGLNDKREATKILWKHEPVQDPAVLEIACCDTINRGVTYADGFIYMNQLDGTLKKLDAATGKVVWEKKVFVEDPNDPNSKPLPTGYTITSSPLYANGKLLIGMGGGEYGSRGFLDCYDTDGNHIWRGYSTGPDEEMKIIPGKTTVLGKPIVAGTGLTYDPVNNPNGTWIESTVENGKGLKHVYKDQWKQGGGATWGYHSYDPELNLVYYGSGNPGTWNPAQRKGDNKWSCAIFARDLDTGEVKWVYQITPHDEWDYDGNMEVILVDSKMPDGTVRKDLVHCDRNGFVYTLDRETGMLYDAKKLDDRVNWVNRIILDKNDPRYGLPDILNPEKSTEKAFFDGKKAMNIIPTAKGLRDIPPPSYSELTKTFYYARGAIAMDYLPEVVDYVEGKAYVGALVDMHHIDGTKDHPYEANGKRLKGGLLTAYNNVTGKKLFENNDEIRQNWSGVLTTGGNLVFYGTLNAEFKALDSKTGKLLWSDDKLHSYFIGNPTTYEHKGKQYVSLPVNGGGWPGLVTTDPEISKGKSPGTAALGVEGLHGKEMRKRLPEKTTGKVYIYSLGG